MSEPGPRWWGSEALDRQRWGALVEPLLERIVVARDRGRLPQALLLVGPPGLGRELAAVETAALLVCHGDPLPWAGGSCAERVRRGIHPDVVAMLPDGKKRTIKIDPVRDEVVEAVSGRPYEGRRRVWIFDGVEEGGLPKESANALLKTLEEPPEHAAFILLAANPSAVLPTIRSRCQRLSLPGAVAVAAGAGPEPALPELASAALAGGDVAGAAAMVRAALAAGVAGELDPVLKLPWTLPDGVPAFATVAMVALEMAAELASEPAGEDLAHLASELLAVEHRSRALNLNLRHQLVSCLLEWYRELQEC